MATENNENNENTVRPEREYEIELEEECGGSETINITVAPGTAADQDATAHRIACERLTDWVRDGDYGADGASVSAWYTMTDAEYEFPRARVSVDIEPHHESLIRAAVTEARGTYADSGDYCGDDPDDHDWSSEGEGGCDENPGVWSTGGTSMAFSTHCRRCGLKRREATTGPQRNPGEHDTVSYSLGEGRWCRDCQAFDCDEHSANGAE